MSNGGVLKTEAKPGLSKVIYPNDKVIVADVTDRVERNKFGLTNSREYLSLSLKVLSADGKRELIKHS